MWQTMLVVWTILRLVPGSPLPPQMQGCPPFRDWLKRYERQEAYIVNDRFDERDSAVLEAWRSYLKHAPQVTFADFKLVVQKLAMPPVIEMGIPRSPEERTNWAVADTIRVIEKTPAMVPIWCEILQATESLEVLLESP